jgi:hypothetical protein
MAKTIELGTDIRPIISINVELKTVSILTLSTLL